MAVNLDEIKRQWEENAQLRHDQIISGNDITFDHVLVPTITSLIKNPNNKRIIDVGCGSGVLSSQLASLGSTVLGVDLSESMINIASSEFIVPEHDISFQNFSIQDFSKQYTGRPFDIAVANMSLITMPNYETALKSIKELLNSKGQLIISITHPCFWNDYRQYEAPDDFNYKQSHSQQGSFQISLNKSGLSSETTHFHRPLSAYCSALRKLGFQIRDILEPYPPENLILERGLNWDFPHILFFDCVLV